MSSAAEGLNGKGARLSRHHSGYDATADSSAQVAPGSATPAVHSSPSQRPCAAVTVSYSVLNRKPIAAAPVPHSSVKKAAAKPPGKVQQSALPAADAPDEVPVVVGDAAQPNKRKPLKKRKVSLFLAYQGAGYQGMQRNPGCKTIEGDLHTALVAAGGISIENSDDFQKVNWSRAARTDKGVSAIGQKSMTGEVLQTLTSYNLPLGSKSWSNCASAQLQIEAATSSQVVSLRMCVVPDILERINEALPAPIRVFGYRRVTNGFDSRKLCDKRRYEYVLPAYAFDPSTCQPGSKAETVAAAAEQLGVQPACDELSAAEAALEGVSAAILPASAAQGGAAVDAASRSRGTDTGYTAGSAALTTEQLDASGGISSTPAVAASAISGARAYGFVFDEACQEKLSAILEKFVGTHNFHNYTVKVSAQMAAARRYILSFSCKGTFDFQGQQWVRMEVVGQSFMMHQIRRMVGMALAEFRGAAPPQCLQLAFDPQRIVEVPMAPALGLLLHECIYDSYNERWGDGRELLRLSDWAAEVETFKAEQIYNEIAACDEQEQINATWLSSLNDRTYHFSRWGASHRVEASISRAVVARKRKHSDVMGGGKQETAGAHVDAEWSD